MSRVGILVTVLVFWVIAIPVLSMVGDYTVDQYNNLQAAGGTSSTPALSSKFFILDLMFFQLPEDIGMNTLWIGGFLWLMTILSAYVAIYFLIDLLHGGS